MPDAVVSEIRRALLARLLIASPFFSTPPQRIAAFEAPPEILRAQYPDAYHMTISQNAAADLAWDTVRHATTVIPYTVKALSAIRRALADGGAFFFATLGPETLLPLRSLRTTAANRFAAWPTMVDLGDALLAAGFVQPVLDRETLTFSYATASDAVAELIREGWLHGPSSSPVGLAAMQALTSATDSISTKIPFEIIYGLAWNRAIKTPDWRQVRFR